MKATRFTLGMCFAIPLPDRRYAYGQYVYFQGGRIGHGHMVRVFDYFTKKIASVEELIGRELLFPPVFVALNPAIRSGRWTIIGELPVGHFQFPTFRRTLGYGHGIFHDWRLWNLEGETFIGDLPVELRALEVLCIWGYEALEERIVTGDCGFMHQM